MRRLRMNKHKIPNKQLIYIAGQITGLTTDEARANFDRAHALLLEKGFIPLNPMALNPPSTAKRWKEYMLDDLVHLFNCEGIFLLDNWKESKGARIEHFIAQEMGMMILTEKDL